MGFLEALRPYWHPVLQSHEVAEQPVKARLLDEALVLYRTPEEVVAFPDLCSHRGTALSLGRVRNGNLECPYHRLQFGPDGRCVHMPSLEPGKAIPEAARMQRYRTRERYGLVWVALEEPQLEIFDYPEYDDASYRTLLLETFEFAASAPRVVENNYDFTHVCFIHEGILGRRSATVFPPVQPYGDDEICFESPGEEPNTAQIWQPGVSQTNPFQYYNRLIPPLATHTRKVGVRNGEETGESWTFVMAASPTAEEQTRFFFWVSLNYGFDVPDEDVIALTERILEQDRIYVESQRPRLIPVDLREELFTASELHHVQYRRWLAEIGV